MADADTQTSPLDTSNIGAILSGMQQAPLGDQTRAPLPPILQPNYQPPQPAALQPQSGPVPLQPQPAPAQPPPQPPAQPAPPQPQVATSQPVAPPAQQSQPQPPAPRFQLGNQPGPWPAAYPNSPRYDPATAPALPGETPQETADLNRHLAHETGSRGNIMNDWAAKDPSLYSQGRTCQGYWQIVNSTWADGAKRAGVDTRAYPTAMSAPYAVQRQVALALYRAYGNAPWSPQPGAGEHGDRAALRPQLPLPPEQRGSEDWGHPAPRSFGPGPEGRPFGQANFMQPGQSGFTRVLNAIGPLLLGIGSLALHLPLSTAITAYSAMAKAQDTGQKEAYDRARTQFQDQLKEANAQQTLESQAASDAFAEYGTNNPQGLQQELARIALQYNDPTMYRMAERGDLNGIHQLQTKRDQYNQDLTKLNKANEEQQDRQAQDAAVAGMDQQWHDKFVQDNNREPTAAEIAIAHNEHIGEAAKAGTKTATGAKEEAKVYNVVDKDTGKPTGRQVRVGQDGGLFNLDSTPTTLAPNEKLGDEAGTKAGTGKEDTGDFTWTNPDGSPGKGYVTNKPGVGLVDPKGNVIPQKEGTYPSKVSSQSMGSQPGGGEAAPSKIEDWPGMNEGDPPANKGITPEAWTAAQQWAREGQAPKGLSSRAGGIYQQAWHALPYALHAVGKTGADMPQDAIDYETRRVAATAAERNFASGQGFRQMVSLNTVAAHIDLFRQYAVAMRNGDNPAMNRIANELSYQTGSPELTNMGIASIVTGDEVIRLLTTTGGSRGDREDIKKNLDANSSPDALMGAADALTNFVRERYEPLHLEYVNRLGAPAATRKMYEEEWQRKMTEPAKIMVREGQRPISGGSPQPQQQTQPAQSQPAGSMPARPAALPQGKTQWDRDSGHWMVNGKEYDANGNPL